jgi:hypothetical protein
LHRKGSENSNKTAMTEPTEYILPVLRLKAKHGVFAHANGRQLVEVTTKHQLQAAEGPGIVTYPRTDEGQLVEQLRRQHGYLVDHQNLALFPTLRSESASTHLTGSSCTTKQQLKLVINLKASTRERCFYYLDPM